MFITGGDLSVLLRVAIVYECHSLYEVPTDAPQLIKVSLKHEHLSLIDRARSDVNVVLGEPRRT